MHINRDVWTYAVEREALRRRRAQLPGPRRTPRQMVTFHFFAATPRP